MIAALAAAPLSAAWTDRGEYDLVLAIRGEGTARGRLALLDQWKTAYPQSELRAVRRELYLAAYQSLGDSSHMLETAREILAEQPDSLVGTYWCVLLAPGADKPTPELWAMVEKAARQLLAGVPDTPAWKPQKASVELLAHRALGWIAWQRGDYPAAEAELAGYLHQDASSAEVSTWYGMALAAQRAPEKVPAALWQLARAGSLQERGALPEGQRRQINALAERIYVSYHGDGEGLERLRVAALASAFPPADFHLDSAEAIAAKKAADELQRTNPQLALWLDIRKHLEAPDGDKYFAETLQPAPLAKLKGTVVRCTPEARPTEVALGLSNGVTEEVVLKLSSPMPAGAEPGTLIEFEGTADSYSRDPFRLTVLTDKSKISGWPETAAKGR